MHASACETLLPFLKPGAKVLDIGSGSGYLTHVLAELVKPNGKVIGVDHIQGLVDMANKNMAKTQEGTSLLESGVAQFVKADGRLGYLPDGPYDAIHVGAAAAEHHKTLVDQLNRPGRYVLMVALHEGGFSDISLTPGYSFRLRSTASNTFMSSIRARMEKWKGRNSTASDTSR